MGAIVIAATIAVTSVSLQPRWPVVEDRVDLIEVNHFYDGRGNHVLDQVIFYDWSAPEGRFHVCDWRLLKCASQWPYRDWSHGGYVVLWRDGSVLRRVRARDYRETWTQHDPETGNRRYLPRSARRELRSLPVHGLPLRR